MKKELDFNNPWQNMVNYIDDRNLSYMNKTEWEQLFTYCWISNKYKKTLLELNPTQMYEIADEFNIDFNQVSSLIKKCKKIEDAFITNDKTYTFADLIDKNAISNISSTETLCVRLKLLNKVVFDEIQRILNTNNIYSDTSFSKDILTMTMDGFCILATGKSNFKISEKSKAIKDKIVNSINDFIGKDNNSNSKTKTNEITQQLALLQSAEDYANLKKVITTLLSLVSPLKNVLSSELLKMITSESSISNIDNILVC